jgi:transposase-like protein
MVDQSRMGKHYSSAIKAQIVQDVFLGEKTMRRIASENNVHPNLLRLSKATAIERFPNLFELENADREAEWLAREKRYRNRLRIIGGKRSVKSPLKVPVEIGGRD